jgi:hypothetical protein
MSNTPFHASVAFALGGSLLLLDGSMGPMALTASVLSLLLDLDSLLSPDQAHERMLHSSYIPLALPPLIAASAIVPLLGHYPTLALAACLSHLALDILRGEPMHPRDPLLRRLNLDKLERPRAAHVAGLLSLPACALLILA